MRFLSCLLLISLLWAAPAHAAGVVTAIGALFTAVKASVIGGLLLRAALTVGLSLLQQKKARSRRRQPGLQTQFRTFGGTQSQSTILGRFATKGHENYRNSHGPNNRYLTQVVELGDLPGISLERVFMDGEASDLGDVEHPKYGRPILSKRSGQTDYAWVKFYDGTQTSADPMLREKYGGDPDRPIDANYILSGVPHAIVTLRFGRKQFPSGEPEITFECLGIPLYDPRKDSSVGGAGAQRWDDPTTWTRSANPIVLSYNIARGLTLPDGTLYGGGAEAEDIPLDSAFAAMNVCDEDIDGRPRYTAGIEVKFAEDEPADIIEDLREAANAQIAEVGGVIYFQAGAPASSITSISDGDIIVTDPTQYDPFPGFDSRFNAVTITHPSPNAAWNGRELELIENSAWIDEDGERRAFDLALPPVYVAEQARQLGNEVLKDQRRFRRHVLPLPPDKFFLKPLDTLDWSSARNNYSGKQFELFEVIYDLHSLNVKVSLRERDAGDFVPDPALEIPDAPASTGPIPATDAGVPGFDVIATSIKDGNGAERRPALRLIWTPDEIVGTVDALAFEVRPAGETALAWEATTAHVEAGAVTVQPLLPAQDYEARGKALSARRDTYWTAWVGATTGDLRLEGADLADDLKEQINTAFDRHDATVEEAEGTVAELRDRVIGALGDIGVPSGGTVGGLPRLSIQDRLEFDETRLTTVEQAASDLEDDLIEAAIASFNIGKRMVDAGVYIEPESGLVKISGIEALGNRQSLVEITVDALASQITQYASTTYVDQKISDALLDPSQIPILDDFEFRLFEAEQTLDGVTGDVTTLSNALKVEGEIVTQTEVVNRLSAAEQALTLRVTTNEFGLLEGRTADVEILLNTLDIPSIQFAVSDTARQRDEIDLADDARVIDLIEGWQRDNATRAADALGRRRITAKVSEDLAAEAQERAELAAVVGDNAALFEETTKVLAEVDALQAEQIETLQVASSTALARILDIEGAYVDEAGARAYAGQEISGALEPGGEIAEGLSDATDAAVSRVASFDIAPGSALAGFRDDVNVALGDGQGGLFGAGVLSGTVAQVQDQGEDLTALAARTGILEVGRDATNLVPNGRVQTGDFAGWTDVADTMSVRLRGTGPSRVDTAPTPFVIQFASDSALKGGVAAEVPVAAGDLFRASFQAAKGSGATGQLVLRLRFFDPDGVEIGTEDHTANPATSWSTHHSNAITAPPGAASMHVVLARASGTTGNFYATDLRVERGSQEGEDIGARVDTIEGAYVDEAGAVAAVDQVVSASFQDLEAMAQATTTVKATVDGIQAAHVLRLNEQNVLEVVSVSDGESGPKVTGRWSGDYLTLDGDVEVEGTFLAQNAIFAGQSIESDNFEAGVSGWQIRRDGVIEAHEVIERAALADSAATDRVHQANEGEIMLPSTGSWETICQISLGPVAIDEIWTVTAFVFRRTASGDSRCQIRFYAEGVWSNWSGVPVLGTGSFATWENRDYSRLIGGKYDDAEVRIQGIANLPPSSYTDALHRDAAITAEKSVK